jgi:hypothetical protein
VAEFLHGDPRPAECTGWVAGGKTGEQPLVLVQGEPFGAFTAATEARFS